MIKATLFGHPYVKRSLLALTFVFSVNVHGSVPGQTITCICDNITMKSRIVYGAVPCSNDLLFVETGHYYLIGFEGEAACLRPGDTIIHAPSTFCSGNYNLCEVWAVG